jgi:tetratricopeptide (TPR) repeat protein
VKAAREFGPRSIFAWMAMFLVPCLALADTIVLKNGRRIVAANVTEEKGWVSYETPAGLFSLPKTTVDHIERGGDPFAGSGIPGSNQNDLPLAPPQADPVRPDDEVARATVHDGSIDREYIARLEHAASRGEKGAVNRVVRAHLAAAQFELAQNDYEQAIAQERRALSFAPEQTGLLLDLAYLHLRRSEYKAALEYLERARRTAPDSPDVAKLSGWAYFGLNKLDQAVAEWRRALSLRPDAEVQAALEKAERDQQAEEAFKENESGHFMLRYYGGAEPALARSILRTLELHFSAIESELDFTPPEPIGVILYTQQTFADITRARGWVGALNDGRIRVPVQGLSDVTPELSRVLKHELTHSFIQQKTQGRCPAWLQEGLAQWMEGQRSGEDASGLVRIYDEKHAVPFLLLEGSWMNFSSDMAAYAYAWSLATVEHIVQKNGMRDMERILDRLGALGSTEAACREVLHEDYDEMARSTAEYLRRTYVR